MSYTKGKWKIGWWKPAGNRFGRSIRLGNGHIIAMAFSGKDKYLKKDKTAEANAKLIVAAPELLEACKRGRQRLLEMGQTESHRTLKILQAAISKAEQEVKL